MQRALGCRVIDLDQSIVDLAGEGAPTRERIADRRCGVGLGGQGRGVSVRDIGGTVGVAGLALAYRISRRLSAVWSRVSRSIL